MTITIYVKVFEGKTKEGKPFNYFKIVDKNGRFVDLRFTRTVTNRPTEDSLVEVKKENINYDKNRLYPCYWVKSIESIRTIREVRWEKDNQNNDIENLNMNDIDLPF